MTQLGKKFLSQPHVVYKKSGLKSASGLNLRSSQWMVLTQVNANQTIQDITNVTTIDIKEVTRILYNLFQLGLIEVHQEEKKEENTLGATFFKNINVFI